MQLESSKKVSLVTEVNGAARTAIASRLVREAAHLSLVISDSAKLRQVSDTLTKAANIAVLVFSADLRDPAEPGQAIAQAVSISAASTRR
jgi:NADP-dependent 3-hydroxy acid dehydrogenase YdfG